MNYTMSKVSQYGFVFGAIAVLALSVVVAPGQARAVDPDPLGVTSFDNASNLGSRPLEETIGGIINVGLSLLGIVAVVIILMGGAKWMTAGGNEDKVGEARQLIVSGIIGLAIIMSAWAIARFVLTRLADQTGIDGASGADAYTDVAP
jgi:hypothetical protein